AVTILDSQRQKRAIDKKIERIAKSGAVIKTKKMAEIKKNIHNLEALKPKAGSFSGAMAKKFKRWVRKLEAKDFEFFALCLPTEPWKKLADLCHFNSEKDFPNAPWFLPFCFGQSPPEGSKVDKCRNITSENVNQLISDFDIPYRLVKNFKTSLNNQSKKVIAERQVKLDTILWYYEDLHSPEVDDIIRARLERGEKVELGYGKLMERLLLFKDYIGKNKTLNSESLLSLLIPIAEKNLKSFRSTLASPVAVLGDASSSMNVAIRTSTIISSLLATICEAKLSFFNHKNFKSTLEPKDIKDVLQVAHDTRASGSTAPAASLVPYFDNKEVIKTFIIVTDEEENTNAETKDKKSWRFFELFMEYRKNVYPASLIFVSFLNQQHSEGQMYRSFLKENVPDVMQFKFSRARPDLTKLDSILGSICSKSSKSFAGDLENIESNLRLNGLTKFLKEINLNSS
ncbi:Ubox domain containing, partial [Brachionus plicatilis]